MKKYFSCLCVLFVVFGFCSVTSGEVVEPNGLTGYTYYSTGTAQASSTCPSWDEALNRNSTDRLTDLKLIVELDGCQIVDHEISTRAQNAGPGYIADLEPDDLIIVWDEDGGHGSDEQHKNFTFSGSYVDVTDDTPDYVKLSTTDSRTNWTVYKVTVSGTLTITDTSENEHDAFHLQRNRLDFEKTDDVSNNDCRGPGDELTYTICWDNTSGSTFENAYIVDYLPGGVDFVSADPSTGSHADRPVHTYTWELGTIGPDYSECVSLTVTVNENAENLYEMKDFLEGVLVDLQAEY